MKTKKPKKIQPHHFAKNEHLFTECHELKFMFFFCLFSMGCEVPGRCWEVLGGLTKNVPFLSIRHGNKTTIDP